MPWVEALTDPSELRRCIRDLVVLSTLPGMWTNYDAAQIGDSVAAALLSMLAADFVYVVLAPDRGEPRIEALHIAKNWTDSPDGGTAIRTALHDVPLNPDEQTGVIANPIGEGTIRVIAAPVSFRGDAVVVAGSRRSNFPSDAQRLLLGIAADTTTIALQRRSAELEERRFLSLVERSTDFIGLASLDGSLRYVNPAGVALVGLDTIEEACGLHIVDFLLPAERIRAREACWPEVIRSGRWGGELVFCHFKTRRPISCLVDWFRIDHPRTLQPINIAAISRDLTAQKRTEAELRRLTESLEHRIAERTAELADTNDILQTQMIERERADVRLQQLQLELFHAARLSTAGHMTAALAHEINQPLTAVSNSIHAVRRLLANDALVRKDTVYAVLDEASQQALRGGQIIQWMRDFVTLGETEKKSENLRDLIEEAGALALFGSGKPQMSFRLDPEAFEIIADRVQIQQVLVNLIRNATEAMSGTEGRELVVTTALVDEDTVEIAVADRGPGLPKEMADGMFRPFVSTKRYGMGLGLVICQSIIGAHGGRLWSEPNPGGGTIFRFTLASAPTAGAANVAG